MTIALTDAYGAPIPHIDASAGHGASLELRRAAIAAEECLDELAAAMAPAWAGVASQRFLDGRAAVSRQATDLADACHDLSRAIVDFADEAAMVVTRWREDAHRLGELEVTLSDPGRAGIDVTDLGGIARYDVLVAERDALQQKVTAWERRFGDAESLLEGAAGRVCALLDDGALSTGDQLWAIPETMTQQMVVEPLALVQSVIDDPTTFDDVAQALLLGLKDQLLHPVRTVEEMLGAPAYGDGRWGEGVGTDLALIAGALSPFKRTRLPDADTDTVLRLGDAPTCSAGVTGGFGLSIPLMLWAAKPTCKVVPPEDRIRFARQMQDMSAPRPKTQTLDQLAAGVDLDASEHAHMGHTLSRHVDVDEEYLEYRLRTGTPLPDGSMGNRPGTASVWTDRATAEAVITAGIRDNLPAIRKWWASGEETMEIAVGPGHDIGLMMRLDGEGDVITSAANCVDVVLARRGDELFIRTTRLSPVGQEGSSP